LHKSEEYNTEHAEQYNFVSSRDKILSVHTLCLVELVMHHRHITVRVTQSGNQITLLFSLDLFFKKIVSLESLQILDLDGL